jgi:putative aminopeptidase FrvX
MKFLKKLIETPGVPGREERVRELVKSEIKGLFDDVRVDPMGTMICRKRPGRKGPKPAPKVLIACHIDEIGFYVRAIDENGFLRVQNVGGFDTRNLFARRVLVQGKKDLVGVLNPSGRPIHIATDEEKKKTYLMSEFFVDLFMPKAEVEKLVRIGDPVTLIQTFEEIGDVVTGKCLDNRAATWVAINAIRKVGNKSSYEIYYAATVQEEVGCRGAGPTAFGIEPDVGIALDTTLCCDTPGIDKNEAITAFGKGVALKIMDGRSISHRGLLDEFVAVAEKKKIPYQLEVLPLGGTDAGSIQQAGVGRRTITLSIPTRYIHTITEAEHKKDLRAATDLLAAWLVG